MRAIWNVASALHDFCYGPSETDLLTISENLIIEQLVGLITSRVQRPQNTRTLKPLRLEKIINGHTSNSSDLGLFRDLQS